MRIRSFGTSSRRSRSAWPLRTACIVIGSLVVLFAVAVVQNVRRHDMLTEWRQSLETATNRPTGPQFEGTLPIDPCRGGQSVDGTASGRSRDRWSE
jgi:hypothetical protein